MKKTLLFLFLLSVSGLVFGQSTTSNLGSGGIGSWLDAKVNGQNVTSWDNGEPAAGQTVIISVNETVYLDKKVDISGSPVRLIIKGLLEFTTAGKLVLPSGSVIEIESSGDIKANTGNESQLLQIGAVGIRSDEIDELSGPAIINESNLCGACAPTPVELLYFKATAQSNAVEINWASSKAWDFSHYELERSSNGSDFDYVATIDAEENSNGIVKYSYSDRQPISGTSYYRLKAVDIDGAFEYKEVAVVKFGAESFKVYPNPSNLGYINVSWSHATEGTTASLRDSAGRVVRTAQINGNNDIISTEGLSAGMYLLSVQRAAGVQQAQVLVK